MKNIIKRIFVCVSIALIVGFVRSCNVKAYTNDIIGYNVEFPLTGATYLSMNSATTYSTHGYRYFYGSTLNPTLYFAAPTGNNFTCGTYGCGMSIDGNSVVKDSYYSITIFLLGDRSPYWHYSYSNVPTKVGVSNSTSTIDSNYWVAPISGTTSLNRVCSTLYDNEYTGNCLFTWTIIFKAPKNGTSIQTWWSSDPAGGDPFSNGFFVGYLFDYIGDNSISPEQLNTALNTTANNISTSINNKITEMGADIIDNQNQNTQQIIDSEKVCFDYTIQIDSSNKAGLTCGYLTENGNISGGCNSGYAVSEYYPINKNTYYNITANYNGYSPSYCTYDSNKVLQSCFKYNGNANIDFLTNFDGYVRFSARVENNYYNRFTGQYCGNGNQQISGQITDVQDKQDTTNQHLEDISNALTDETGPNLNGLQNSAGWLPPGPVDSILNLPLSLLNNLTVALEESCTPAVLDIPYVNSQIILPCMTDVYEEIGITSWVNVIGGVASAFMLFAYFCKLYKWVDDTLTFRENNYIDNWGGV